MLLTLAFAVIAVYYDSGYSEGSTAFTDGNLYYEVTSENEVSVTGAVIASGPLIISSSVEYDGVVYAVTSISDWAFFGCLGFTGNLIIPSSVTAIGDWAFAGCGGRGFSVDSNNLYYKSVDGLLISKDGKTVIACPIGNTGSMIIPDGVVCIDDYAFFGCLGFTGSLIIPDSVTTIGDYAFFGYSGFTGSLIIGQSVVTIGDCAFSGCRGFTGSLIIPDSVTTIGDWAFCNCSGFTESLIIGDSVTTIGHDTFFGCSGFTGSLVIGQSVVTIDDYAFFGCYGFTGNLIIPDDVTIGDSALFCYGLTYIVIPSNVKFETSSPFIGIFYAEDGTTELEQTVENLCGYTFKNYHINHYVVNNHDA